MFKTIRSKILFLVIGLMSVTSATLIFITTKNFQQQITAQYLGLAKDTIQSTKRVMETEHSELVAYEINTIKNQRSIMEDIGTSVLSMVASCYDLQKTGILTEEAAQKQCMKFLDKFRYQKNSYFFVYDFDLKGLIHPDKNMVGQKWSGFKDLNQGDALKIIKESIKSKKKIFKVFMWPKFHDKKLVKQMGFFIYFPQWEWIIGTAMELDDIKEIAFKKEENITFKLKNILDKMSLNDIGGILVFDSHGKVITHTSNLPDSASYASDFILDKSMVNHLMQASDSPEESTEYQNVYNKQEKLFYTAFVDYYKYTDWYITAYVSNAEIQKISKTIAVRQSIILVSVLMIGMFLAFFITQKISDSLWQLTKYAKNLSDSDFKQEKDPLLQSIGANTDNEEIKELTSAFMLMESQIGKNIRAMENHQSNLKSLVKKRTQELIKSNESLKLENEERKLTEKEKEKLINELQKTLDEVKTLSGLIPICARCKKIRDDKGYWNNLENYIERHSKVLFSHGMCLECSDELYGDKQWYIKSRENRNEVGEKQQ
jgi:hypothetical protein